MKSLKARTILLACTLTGATLALTACSSGVA